jgi:group I intron endonuclease
MIGIYKITSPSGRIYIGQSVNINKRKRHYSYYDCKSQKKLYNSLKKYTWEKHIFEIVEECDEILLNERERYYQELYNTTSNTNLNCKLTKTNSKSGKLSEETKLKISIANKGRKYSSEVLENIRKLRKTRICSEETKLKMSISAKNKIVKKETLDLKSKQLKERFSKKVINLITKEIFSSCTEAAKHYNVNVKTLSKKLSGLRKNTTDLIYLNNYICQE